jgi:hypothetical protein
MICVCSRCFLLTMTNRIHMLTLFAEMSRNGESYIVMHDLLLVTLQKSPFHCQIVVIRNRYKGRFCTYRLSCYSMSSFHGYPLGICDM